MIRIAFLSAMLFCASAMFTIAEAQVYCPDDECVCPEADCDGDGVGHEIDNCQDAINSGQDDTDADDCGNLCDADYDNNGYVGFPDFGLVVANFGKSSRELEELCHFEPIPGCTVDFLSFGFLVANFGRSPGPSGTTAGTTACPATPTATPAPTPTP